MRKKGPARRIRAKHHTDLGALFYKQGGRCRYCKRAMTLGGNGFAAATRDHVVPRAAGGKQKGNLVAACGDCNSRKGSMSAEEFKRWLANPLAP